MTEFTLAPGKNFPLWIFLKTSKILLKHTRLRKIMANLSLLSSFMYLSKKVDLSKPPEVQLGQSCTSTVFSIFKAQLEKLKKLWKNTINLHLFDTKSLYIWKVNFENIIQNYVRSRKVKNLTQNVWKGNFVSFLKVKLGLLIF